MIDANKLKAELRANGLTQADFAKEMKKSAYTINKKINNQVEFTVNEIIDACKILKIKNPIPIFLPEISHICDEL